MYGIFLFFWNNTGCLPQHMNLFLFLFLFTSLFILIVWNLEKETVDSGICLCNHVSVKHIKLHCWNSKFVHFSASSSSILLARDLMFPIMMAWRAGLNLFLSLHFATSLQPWCFFFNLWGIWNFSLGIIWPLNISISCSTLSLLWLLIITGGKECQRDQENSSSSTASKCCTLKEDSVWFFKSF